MLNSRNGKAIVAKSPKDTWTSYYADNMNLLTPQILRDIYADAGVFIYSANDRNVQADSNFVSITVTDDNSTENIFVPVVDGNIYELTTGHYFPVVNQTVTVSNAEAHTYVFYIGTHSDFSLNRKNELCQIASKIYAHGGKDTAYLSMNQKVNVSAYLATTENFYLNEQPVLTYIVANSSIARVDSNGVITGISKGKTKLTIRYKELETTITIKVI